MLRHGLIGASMIATAALAQAPPQPPLARVEATRLAVLNKGAFLESIVALQDGRLLIADHDSHTILSLRPEGGAPERFAKLDFEVRGLGLDLDDTLYATGKAHGGGEAVFRIDRQGRATPVATLPEAKFLNGLALLRPGVFLAADSFAGAVWRIDVRTGATEAWLRHEWLTANPDMAQIPGANGVKLHDGAAYVSNSGRAHVLRVPISPDGTAGPPAIHASGVVIDDFAFAANGDLYGTTHIFNSVVVLRKDGTRATIATAEDGATGSTAVVFGTRPADRETLYVVGDGGVFLPPPGGIVPAEIVALKVGAVGLTREGALGWVPRPATVPAAATQLVECATAPGTDHLRASVGPRYLRYLELNNDRIAFAGQLFDDPKASPVGRMYFVRTESTDEARAYIEASPYFAAGMYANCRVRPFQGILGSLLGGVGWPAAASALPPN
jgi:sugar lactone lactonase YvrE/uncharacterized protein YciI